MLILNLPASTVLAVIVNARMVEPVLPLSRLSSTYCCEQVDLGRVGGVFGLDPHSINTKSSQPPRSVAASCVVSTLILQGVNQPVAISYLLYIAPTRSLSLLYKMMPRCNFCTILLLYHETPRSGVGGIYYTPYIYGSILVGVEKGTDRQTLCVCC